MLVTKDKIFFNQRSDTVFAAQILDGGRRSFRKTMPPQNHFCRHTKAQGFGVGRIRAGEVYRINTP